MLKELAEELRDWPRENEPTDGVSSEQQSRTHFCAVCVANDLPVIFEHTKRPSLRPGEVRVEVSTFDAERAVDRARKLRAAVERIHEATRPETGDLRIADADRQRVLDAAATMPAANLSEGQRQIWDVLAASPERLSTNKLLDALEKKHGPTSEGVLKQNLAELVKRGLLDNRQDVRPKGYGIPGRHK